ncbi:ABC transporter substrate-binding protein, partial [Frankia sp. CiP1_Cm_nod2]
MVGRLTAMLGRLFVTGPRRRLHRVFAVVVAVIVVLVAVLAVALTGGSPAHGPSATRTRTATLGLIAPLSADRASVGTAVRNAVRLAVDEANAQGTIPGWKVRLSVQDDLSRPDGGARAAGTLAADQTLIGVVGPLSSTVAMVALPTLDAAGIAVISPSNSQPELTGAPSSAAPAPSTARSR